LPRCTPWCDALDPEQKASSIFVNLGVPEKHIGDDDSPEAKAEERVVDVAELNIALGNMARVSRDAHER
jgi:hypothetical protein